MRKLFAILAFCGLLFLSGGYYLLYKLRLAEIKTAVKKDLFSADPQNMAKLSFSDAEADALQWDGDDEFNFRGEMYDVVRTGTENGRTVYWCLPDKKETSLIDHYLNTQHSSDNDLSHSLFKLLSLPFLAVTFPVHETCFAGDQFFFSPFLFILPTSGKNVLTPPPKVC